jgi:hypothetical protein
MLALYFQANLIGFLWRGIFNAICEVASAPTVAPISQDLLA